MKIVDRMRFVKSGLRSMSSKLRPLPSTDVTLLPSGMRVASQTLHGETASVGVWIDTGSRYENLANNGVAHFLEHITFKGTTQRTQFQLEEEIENMGAHLNAYTSREQTVYYARVFKQDARKAMEILSDILTNSLKSEGAIERERDVILREMIEVNKIYEELVLDNLHEVAYPTSGLGYTILGPEENIKKISKKDIQEYVAKHYTANRFVIAGAGAVDHQELVDIAQECFGKLPTSSMDTTKNLMTKGVFQGGERRIRYDTMKEAHLCLAYEGVSWTSELALPVMILQTIFGSWDRSIGTGNNMVSRLAQDLARDDAAESFMTFNTSYKDTGIFGIYIVADPSNLQATLQHVTTNFLRACHDLTDEEVNRAKNQLKASLLVQLDNYSNICEDIGRQMLTYDRRISLPEILSKVDQLTREDVILTARVIFGDTDHALVGVGPIQNLPSYDWIREKTVKGSL